MAAILYRPQCLGRSRFNCMNRCGWGSDLTVTHIPVTSQTLVFLSLCMLIHNKPYNVNSLVPGRYGNKSNTMIFKLIIQHARKLHSDEWEVNIDSGCGLVRQATIHYVGQYWLRSMSPYSVSRLQRVSSQSMWCNVWHNFERVFNVMWRHKSESPSA